MSAHILKLSDVLDRLESGKRPKGGVKAIKAGIPSIGGEHLQSNGGFKFDKLKYVPLDFASTMKKGRIQPGDILVVKDGATTGKTSYVGDDFPYADAVINEHVFLCRTNEKVESKYIFYYLWSERGRRNILEDFRGAAQGGISTNFAEKIKIPIPSRVQQRAIIDKIDQMFSELDSSLRQMKDSQKLLTTLKASVLKRLFFQTEHTVKLPEILVEPLKNGLSAKASLDNTGIPTLTLSAVTNNDFSIKNVKNTVADPRKANGLWLENGDILIERSNTPELVGISATYKGENNYAIFPDLIIRMRVDKSKVLTRFAQYYLDYLYISGFFMKASRGTSGTMTKINQDILNKIEFPAVPIDQQVQLLEVFDTLFSEIEKQDQELTKSISEILTLKQAVLSKAFKGELV